MTHSEFETRLRDSLSAEIEERLSTDGVARLFAHYREMRLWNRRLSLVGPGTAGDVVERHYAESLAVLPWLEGATVAVDVGSGAGFPGLILAAVVPGLDVVAIEPRQRKWAFLESALRKMRNAASADLSPLSCRILNARVERPLPPSLPTDIDLVTSRALAVPSEVLGALHESHPRARFLLWIGRDDLDLPEGLSVRRELALPGSDARRVIEVR